jgi:hypothetical protein
VIWDLRAGTIDLRDYYVSYGWDSTDVYDSTYNAIDLLMNEAWNHGINFANARGEIMRMTLGQLSEPDTSDFFVNVAEIVRGDSLHLIAGGFFTDTSFYSESHNDSVITYLADYCSLTVGPGKFIGVFGFDEPDARYEGPSWSESQHNTVWYDLVEEYAEESRDSISGDILPFGTFLDRWRTQNDSLYYQTTIPLFCEELEYPVFDRYPCQYSRPVDRTFPDQIEFDEIIGSTDLLPSDSVDYHAYANQDEIFSVDDDGWFRVYEFENVTSHTTPISVSVADSIQLPDSLRTDPVWAASDFRAVDVGDRDSTFNRLNGAVVFFDEDDPDENMVIFHDGSNLVFLEDSLNLPGYATGITAVCVGEYNYPVHHPTLSSRRGSVISHGELRILVCYQAIDHQQKVDSVRVFSWNYSTEEFDDVTGDSQGLELDITPTGAVWGVFWPTYSRWKPEYSDDESGFIVYDDSGNYQVIYEYMPQGEIIPEWAVSNEYSHFIDMDETSFIARQTYRFPCFTAGMDYICHLKVGDYVDEAVLKFMSDPEGSVGSGLNTYESDSFELPRLYMFSDVNNAASCRPLRFYDDALLVSFDFGTDSSEVYRSTGFINLRGGDEISISLDDDYHFIDSISSDNLPLLTAGRLYNVRQTYRVPMVFDPTDDDPTQTRLLYGDITVEDTGDMFAEQHVALDTMFVYGIDSTPRANCLMHNLRCEGRRQDGQLTFYPSADSLLYLMTTSLVHGCRGIHLRALDLTMRCGNGGGATEEGTYRCPNLMLNWGPSVETTNPDMIARLLNVVQSLTGKNTSEPDFMSALISDDWDIMDSDDAENARYFEIGGWKTDLDNDSLNFIAFIESSSNNILLLAINDSSEILDYYASSYYYIHFPNKNGLRYTPHHVAGFVAGQFDYTPDLALNFFEMPAYTASLYWIEWEVD